MGGIRQCLLVLSFAIEICMLHYCSLGQPLDIGSNHAFHGAMTIMDNGMSRLEIRPYVKLLQMNSIS